MSMNGVDKADQFTVYYSFIRKSRKWWRKLFFWMFEVTVVNSYILYKISIQSPLSHLHYRRSVVDSLASRHLSTAPPRPRPGRSSKRPLSSSGNPERFNSRLRHFPAKGQQSSVQCAATQSKGQGNEQLSTAKGARAILTSAQTAVLRPTTPPSISVYMYM